MSDDLVARIDAISRRSFLKGLAGILAAASAPAILPNGIIMPIRQLWTPDKLILWGDGEHDDAVALQAFVDGYEVFRPDGESVGWIIHNGFFTVSMPIELGVDGLRVAGPRHAVLSNAHIAETKSAPDRAGRLSRHLISFFWRRP